MRNRASAAGLLPRMEARPWRDGKTVTYRFHPHTGKPINLGTDRQEALRRVLDMNGLADNTGTLGWVWEQMKLRPKWAKLAAVTKSDYETAWKQIDKRLGHIPISAIDPAMVARYVHQDRADSPRRADIEKTVLSKLFGVGVMLGVCTTNAAKDVEPHGAEARTQAPDAVTLMRFLAWLDTQSPQIRIAGMAAEFAALAGSRKAEFLDLTWLQVGEDVVRMTRAKQRGKKRGEVIDAIGITPRLAALLERLRALRKNDCTVVFPTKGGNFYTPAGFKTLWQRAVAGAVKAGVIDGSHFTFHDLRAYYATTHKTERGALPDMHKDPGTTARIYDRNRTVKRSAL